MSQWQAFQASYIPQEALTKCRPLSVCFAVLTPIALALITAYLEPIASLAQLQNPWIPSIFFMGAGTLALGFYHFKGQGHAAALFTLADTMMSVSGLAVLTISTEPPVSYAFAGALGLMLVAAQAQDFSLTLLFTLATCGPAMGIVSLGGNRTVDLIIVTVGCMLSLWASYHTGQRRTLYKHTQELRDAFTATDQIAKESMELALSSTLLTIGNFLHELRNTQMNIGLSLEYVLQAHPDDVDFKDALQDALDGHHAIQCLTEKTIEDLRDKSNPKRTGFSLREVFEKQTWKPTHLPTIRLTNDIPSFMLSGVPEYLHFVLTNLVRNANQAGASEIRFSFTLDPSATSVMITIIDDGPGFSEDTLATMFQPFARTSSSTGLGLGLYLVKRYTEMMGGKIEGGNNHSGGAMFRIYLPGQINSAAMS